MALVFENTRYRYTISTFRKRHLVLDRKAKVEREANADDIRQLEAVLREIDWLGMFTPAEKRYMEDLARVGFCISVTGHDMDNLFLGSSPENLTALFAAECIDARRRSQDF